MAGRRHIDERRLGAGRSTHNWISPQSPLGPAEDGACAARRPAFRVGAADALNQ
jgi:hypothetical protein